MINYLHRMLDMLTGAYVYDDTERAKIGEPPVTNVGKLFSLHGGALQLLHAHADKVLLWDNIDYAQGKTLDRYGENFGVARQGTPDSFYRLLIKVKMLAQLSGGDIDTVIHAAAELLGVDTDKIDLDEIFPAKIWVYVDKDELTDESVELIELIWQMIHRIVAAGIWIKLWLRVYVRHEYDIIYNAGAAIEPMISAWQIQPNVNGEYNLYYSIAPVIRARVSAQPVS
ncbi:hypothetical protein AGMMS49992_28590 [Clostridia bacterium]|nr:hypothetical protein AGMMS49992_28590 [Clostridia bacterium]